MDRWRGREREDPTTLFLDVDDDRVDQPVAGDLEQPCQRLGAPQLLVGEVDRAHRDRPQANRRAVAGHRRGPIARGDDAELAIARKREAAVSAGLHEPDAVRHPRASDRSARRSVDDPRARAWGDGGRPLRAIEIPRQRNGDLRLGRPILRIESGQVGRRQMARGAVQRPPACDLFAARDRPGERDV